VFCNCTTQQTPILPIKSLRIRPGQKSAPKRLIIRFTRQNWINLKATPAVRRNTSEGTSYSLVRLDFRPYTQIKQTICTLVLLPGLHQFVNWLHHSSCLDHKISGPNSYALTQIGSPFCNGNLNTIGQCCTCHLCKLHDHITGGMPKHPNPLLSLRAMVYLIYHNTCIDIRLLGPCSRRVVEGL